MLNFVLPILKDEVNTIDLILIEGMRAFFPKLYSAIRSEPDVFLRDSLEFHLSFNKEKGKDQFEELQKEFLAGLTKQETDGALFALQVLFPNVGKYGIPISLIMTMEVGKKKKRICTSRYFHRYFNYGIPPNDVSDKEVKLLIASLPEINIEQIMKSLKTLCVGNRADILFQKLNTYEDEITSDQAGKIALAIARRSDLIPESHPEDNFFGLGSLAKTAFLLRELISRIEDSDNRENIAKDVAKNIEQLPFAYEFYKKIRKLRKEQDSTAFVAVVSDQCELEIGHIFAEKLVKSAESAPLEDSCPLWKRDFYIEWRWSNQESLQQYAQRRLKEYPRDVNKFLNAILGLSDSRGSDFFRIPDANAEYGFLAKIIPPDEMMNFIRDCYPQMNTLNLPPTVRWYVQMYEQATSHKSIR